MATLQADIAVVFGAPNSKRKFRSVAHATFMNRANRLFNTAITGTLSLRYT